MERLGDDSEGEDLSQGEWEEGDREMALEVLKDKCEIRTGHVDSLLANCLRYDWVAF
ncbi:MAG: hypothetical protein ACR2JR_13420 [Rubrobacteraceae bacterium]